MIDEQFCVHCAEKKTKTFSQMRKMKRIYVNEKGQEWHGSRCPECYTAYKKNYDAARRLKKGHIPLGTICVCQKCNNQFELKQGKDSALCSACRRKS
jgi:hypothetical protein